MTPPPRPRALVHRGVVPARGFVVDERALGAAGAKARVLAHWEPGARVVRLEDGALALLLPRARWVSAGAAPGAPLAAAEGALSAAPLAPAELAALAPPRGAIVRVRAAEAHAHARPEPVDPSLWLDLSPFAIVETRALGADPPAPVLVAQALHASARAVFGDAVAPPPPQMREAREALAKAREGRLPDERRAAPGADPDRPANPLLFAAGAFVALGAWLAARLARPARAPSRGRPGAPTRAPARAGGSADPSAAQALAWLAPLFALLGRFFGPPAPAAGAPGPAPAPAPLERPEAPDEPSGRLRAFLVRLLLRARLGALLGRRQAEYVRTMLRLFDEGDLEQALRHAIPLRDEPGEPGPPALGVPRPRADLTIGLVAGGAGPALRFSEDLFDHLKKLYRKAFERLDQGGKRKEAAFVLAELLGESEEAVSYLERNSEFRLAAELAEARALPPPLVVRQWALARDLGRAVLVARRHDVFAQAVERLGDTDEGRALRLLWAETLAAAGRYAAAVDVALPVAAARRLALRWAELGTELGGEAGARLLARRPALEAALAAPIAVAAQGAEGRGPLAEARASLLAHLRAAIEARRRDAGAYERLRPTLETWLEAEGPGAHAARLALADQLAREAPSPAVRAMASATLRALLHDYPNAASAWGRRECEALARAAGDAALEADLPPLPARTTKAWPAPDGAPLALDFDAADAGTQGMCDLCPLPGGRLLVALGEAGALLLGPSGKRLASFPRPAYHLVVSDEGDRAIALAPRGGLMRLSRLNLLDRRSDDWCDAKVGHWARTFDGERWVVASRSDASGEGVRAPFDLWVVDALDDRWQALHRVPDLGTHLLLLERGEGECVVVSARPPPPDPAADAEFERALRAGAQPYPPDSTLAFERWRFRPACETLLERSAFTHAGVDSLISARLALRPGAPSALFALTDPSDPRDARLVTWSGRDVATTTLPGLEGRAGPIVAFGQHVAVASRRPDEGACVVGVWHAPAGGEARPLATLRFHGASGVLLRASRGLLVAGDDLGRVVSLDAETGALVHDARV